MEALHKEDISKALEKVGVQEKDTLFIHSFLGAFGPFPGGLDDILAGMKEAVPSGTLIFPTYNYDFCHGSPYNHALTPSQVGQLTEFARKQLESVRVLHPVYSHAVIGEKQEYYAQNPSTSAFGKGSLFERLLLDPDAKILFFGVGWERTTFIHHVEEMLNVPYRFLKTFTGKVTYQGNTWDYEAHIFSRYLELNIQLDLTHFKPLLTRTELGRGAIHSVNVLDFYTFALEGYQKNPYFFLRGDPWSKL